MFENKHFTIAGVYMPESKRFYKVILSVHCFYVKTKMLAGFQICISVPLNENVCENGLKQQKFQQR